MFYISSGIFALIMLFSFNFNAHSQNLKEGGIKNGNIIYYSEGSSGFYIKASEEKIEEEQVPQTYIVLDGKGHYYNYIDENGGGGSYSSDIPEEIEELYKASNMVGHVVFYPKIEAPSEEIKTKDHHKLTDEEITHNEISIASLYPMYFDD